MMVAPLLPTAKIMRTSAAGPFFSGSMLKIETIPLVSEKRRHNRFEAGQLVDLVGPKQIALVRLDDLSEAGARIGLELEHDLKIGNPVLLRLLDGSHVRCEVIWSTANAIGLHFYNYLDEPQEHICLEWRGVDYYRSILKKQSQATPPMPKLTVMRSLTYSKPE